MLDVYVFEMRQRQENERLRAVTRLGWRWFGGKRFCAECLLAERDRTASVE
ncbi:hypothetical protein [Paenibacillus sp.]|uniref:hypothetical protein n=1 Tax=Paenibacillus sp. TaxID=58172 RepID=UPI002D56ADBE|nr:hypothetical protein [Paenibacillus sp.]HZG83434.1 hypothetical protein [Paenibacillus sp.]